MLLDVVGIKFKLILDDTCSGNNRSSVPFQLLGVTESPRALAVLAHRFPRASLEPDERRVSGWHQGITSLLV